jgi:2,3-dihydroxybenzoate decarboxylase
MAGKIALEEHFLCPGFQDYWNPTAADLPAAIRDAALARLTDFG